MVNYNEAAARDQEAFYGSINQPNSAGNFSAIGLTCPANKLLMIDKIIVQGGSAITYVHAGIITAALVGWTAGAALKNKYSGMDDASTVFQTKNQAGNFANDYAGPMAIFYMPTDIIGTSSRCIWEPKAPIIVAPGHTFVVSNSVAGQGFTLSVEAKELG